jgi:hypothetical protein
MATYPLATLACTIDENGISAPSYADILASLQASFQSIYGSDIYIEADSQDGQWLATIAQIINDGNHLRLLRGWHYRAKSRSTACAVTRQAIVLPS